jgi:Predicted integral membrane protein
MILLYPLIGAVLVLGSGNLSTSSLVIAGASGGAGAVITVLAVATLRSERAALALGDAAGRIAARIARLLQRDPPEWSGRSLVRVRGERLADLRRRWPVLTVATLGNQLTAYLIFELSVRSVGIPVATLSPSESFLAWAIGRVISSLPLTPGGIGFVELGMIGTLVGFGAPHAHVVAAVLLYRGLVIVPTLLVGAVGLIAFRIKRAAATTD